MKQVLIRKNDQIKELSGSRISFYHKTDNPEPNAHLGVSVSDRQITKLVFPFAAKIVSGGTLDIDFSLPENVASKGITLLGAYWDGTKVTAYLRSILDLPQWIPEEEPVLIGTLVQVTTMRQIEDALLGDYKLNEEKSGAALVLEKEEPKPKKRGRNK
jgi:hypothetical protein